MNGTWMGLHDLSPPIPCLLLVQIPQCQTYIALALQFLVQQAPATPGVYLAMLQGLLAKVNHP